jgi:hypothetical protein
MKCAGCEIQWRALGFCFVAGRHLDEYDRESFACSDDYLLVVAEGLRGQANRCDAEVIRRERVRWGKVRSNGN